jgi:RNA polymerase sigma-70 factor (ECF subfamily)
MRKGDRERARRFETLFAAHSADVVAYCGWRSASSADAQDAVAEVFLAAWRRLDEIPDGDGQRVWLYATARRVMANQRRSHRRRVALHERLALETTPVFEQQPAPSAEEALVHEALRELGPRDREVLLLAEWENLSPAEIGAVLGCLTVTARGRLHRARSRFRAVFEELAGAPEHEQPEPRTSAEADSLYLLRPTAALRAATPLTREEHGSV